MFICNEGRNTQIGKRNVNSMKTEQTEILLIIIILLIDRPTDSVDEKEMTVNYQHAYTH